MKQETVQVLLRITPRQDKMLEKLSNVSLKSKTALMREALELLFRTPGSKELMQ